ncbi:MAG TPA: NfeD family protein [Anaerolineales bacterium]|nr:NfeD family protein [Anaerolineales bacterium]
MPPQLQVLFETPNLVFIILVAGIWASALALVVPGTGALEVVSVFCLLVAGYGALSLPINLWAVVILLLGAASFVAAIVRPQKNYFIIASAVLLTAGSILLFRGESGRISGVSWPLAAGATLLTIGFFWLVVHQSLKAHRQRPTMDPGRLTGEFGETLTEVRGSGSIQLASEIWSARSREAIPPGTRVRVVGREGLVLLVEPAAQPGEGGPRPAAP